jgi:hypothetical protein
MVWYGTVVRGNFDPLSGFFQNLKISANLNGLFFVFKICGRYHGVYLSRFLVSLV